ncbi:MAG: N-methylhydantoinase A [Gammaproteobacteria bacterium]|jgi:N-methylhydantoinase A
MLSGRLRVTVDIGGTFTDLHVLEEHSGRQVAFKTPTTPEDPSAGLMQGIESASEQFGFSLEQVGTLIHGTTIATNAVLEDKLPRAALVTTTGFRDVLEIGRHVRRDVYAARAEERRVLVPRSHRYEIGGRISAAGEEIEPLDEEVVRVLAQSIAGADVQTVAVCLLHSYANPSHELRVGELFAQVLGADVVSLSHQVSPQLREYERTSTTVLNALLMPVVRGYLQRLSERMKVAAFNPILYLVQSNAGVTSPRMAAAQPARLLLSGPSGGALAVETLGRRLGESNLVGIDMGGTSFDVCVVHQGRARLVSEGQVDGCPVRLPMVEIRTIGAGGGSIARAQAGARLQVGPQSAGAMPGPVSYRRGGVEPTVTDANVALGRIDPDYFLGGAMSLDAAAAQAAIRSHVAEPLDLDDIAAAAGVLRIAVSHMAAAIRLSLFEKGLDPKDFVLVSFGGAGGLHAAEVAVELGARRVVYPQDAGTLSAWGMLFCDVVHDVSRSRLRRIGEGALAEVVELASELAREGQERLAADGIAEEHREYALFAELRYAGQASEIAVPFDSITPDAQQLARAIERFHELHQVAYAHSDATDTPELVTLRVTATGRLPMPVEPDGLARAPMPELNVTRPVHLDGVWADVPVLRREVIGAGVTLHGPLIIEEPYAVIVLPADWTLHCAVSGELVATVEGKS